MIKRKSPLILQARKKLHRDLKASLLKTDARGVPSVADKDSKTSVAIATGMFSRLGVDSGTREKAQTSGTQFESAIEEFIRTTFLGASALRPGHWTIKRCGTQIDQFQQFLHLSDIQAATKQDPALAASIGQDYLIRPDIVILRSPDPDEIINASEILVDESIAKLTGIRSSNNKHDILHASISCKWTLRSDRAQNARSEGLNLIRNRKGRVPHIAVVLAEPLPSRIASLALGTGDIDYVYHIALDELVDAAMETDYDDSKEMINTMIAGNRLRDISDLPMDLII